MKKILLVYLLGLSITSMGQTNLDSLLNLWNDSSLADTIRLLAIDEIATEGYLVNQPDSAFYFAGLQYEFAKLKGLKEQEAKALGTQGAAFYHRGKYIKAIDYHNRSLTISEEIGDKLETSFSLTNIGNIHFDQGKYLVALDYFNRSLIISRKIDNKLGVGISLVSIATIYKKQKKYSKAKDYFLQALFIVQEIGSAKEIKVTSNNLYEVYKATGQSAKALEMYELFIATKDNIESKENPQEVIRQELKSSYKRIIIADSIHIIEAKKIIDAQLAAQQAQLSKEQMQRYSLFSGLVILLIFTALIYDRFKKARKQEKFIEATLNELRETQSQLIHSGKMAALGQLTAGIAHEINNPIGFIKSNSFAMEKDLKDLFKLLERYKTYFKNNSLEVKKIKEFEQEIDADLLQSILVQELEGIKLGVKRTSAIIKGLQDFSFKDATAMAPANIHEGLNTTLKILRSRFNHNIQLVKEYDPIIGEVTCHIGQLNQVFMNLLTNALDAIGENQGEIIIKTKKAKDAVEISIKDNGTGIFIAFQDKIFEPFFTTKKPGEGTGLGLSISHGIIENHKGMIKVNSEVGEGSEFIVDFPIGK
jgi:signal transduction histidine kinase